VVPPTTRDEREFIAMKLFVYFDSDLYLRLYWLRLSRLIAKISDENRIDELTKYADWITNETAKSD